MFVTMQWYWILMKNDQTRPHGKSSGPGPWSYTCTINRFSRNRTLYSNARSKKVKCRVQKLSERVANCHVRFCHMPCKRKLLSELVPKPYPTVKNALLFTNVDFLFLVFADFFYINSSNRGFRDFFWK